MAVTEIFQKLFAKQQAEIQTAKQQYAQLVRRLLANQVTDPDEIDQVLKFTGYTAQQLQDDVENSEKRAELQKTIAEKQKVVERRSDLQSQVDTLQASFAAYKSKYFTEEARLMEQLRDVQSKAMQLTYDNENLRELDSKLIRLNP